MHEKSLAAKVSQLKSVHAFIVGTGTITYVIYGIFQCWQKDVVFRKRPGQCLFVKKTRKCLFVSFSENSNLSTLLVKLSLIHI